MSKRNLLAGEAAVTCQVLTEAARKLLQWADLVQAAGNVDIIPAEHLRERWPGVTFTLPEVIP